MNGKLESLERWEAKLKQKVLNKECTIDEKIEACEEIYKNADKQMKVMYEMGQTDIGHLYFRLKVKADAAASFLQMLAS